MVVALALVLAAPMAIAAEPAAEGIQGAFQLVGTHGYRLTGVIMTTGRSGTLLLYVQKKGETAKYIAHGEATTEGADFELGALGTVDVVLRKSGRMETVRLDCGKAFKAEAVEYVGRIEFHGEGGFTEATATSTPLAYKPLGELICSGGTVSESIGGTGSGFKLRATKKSGPSLVIQRNRAGDKVHYEARVKEKSGKVTVNRFAFGRLASGSLSVERGYEAVSFSGRGPFSGRATFAMTRPPRAGTRDIGTWRGDLTVDLPGRPHLRLAGPGFSASTMHAIRRESRG